MKTLMKSIPRTVTLQQLIMSGMFSFTLTVEEHPEEIYIVITGSTGGKIGIKREEMHVWPAISNVVPVVNINTGKLKLFSVSKEVFAIHNVKVTCDLMIT